MSTEKPCVILINLPDYINSIITINNKVKDTENGQLSDIINDMFFNRTSQVDRIVDQLGNPNPITKTSDSIQYIIYSEVGSIDVSALKTYNIIADTTDGVSKIANNTSTQQGKQPVVNYVMDTKTLMDLIVSKKTTSDPLNPLGITQYILYNTPEPKYKTIKALLDTQKSLAQNTTPLDTITPKHIAMLKESTNSKIDWDTFSNILYFITDYQHNANKLVKPYHYYFINARAYLDMLNKFKGKADAKTAKRTILTTFDIQVAKECSPVFVLAINKNQQSSNKQNMPRNNTKKNNQPQKKALFSGVKAFGSKLVSGLGFTKKNNNIFMRDDKAVREYLLGLAHGEKENPLDVKYYAVIDTTADPKIKYYHAGKLTIGPPTSLKNSTIELKVNRPKINTQNTTTDRIRIIKDDLPITRQNYKGYFGITEAGGTGKLVSGALYNSLPVGEVSQQKKSREEMAASLAALRAEKAQQKAEAVASATEQLEELNNLLAKEEIKQEEQLTKPLDADALNAMKALNAVIINAETQTEEAGKEKKIKALNNALNEYYKSVYSNIITVIGDISRPSQLYVGDSTIQKLKEKCAEFMFTTQNERSLIEQKYIEDGNVFQVAEINEERGNRIKAFMEDTMNIIIKLIAIWLIVVCMQKSGYLEMYYNKTCHIANCNIQDTDTDQIKTQKQSQGIYTDYNYVLKITQLPLKNELVETIYKSISVSYINNFPLLASYINPFEQLHISNLESVLMLGKDVYNSHFCGEKDKFPLQDVSNKPYDFNRRMELYMHLIEMAKDEYSSFEKIKAFLESRKLLADVLDANKKKGDSQNGNYCVELIRADKAVSSITELCKSTFREIKTLSTIAQNTYGTYSKFIQTHIDILGMTPAENRQFTDRYINMGTAIDIYSASSAPGKPQIITTNKPKRSYNKGLEAKQIHIVSKDVIDIYNILLKFKFRMYMYYLIKKSILDSTNAKKKLVTTFDLTAEYHTQFRDTVNELHAESVKLLNPEATMKAKIKAELIRKKSEATLSRTISRTVSRAASTLKRSGAANITTAGPILHKRSLDELNAEYANIASAIEGKLARNNTALNHNVKLRSMSKQRFSAGNTRRKGGVNFNSSNSATRHHGFVGTSN